MMKENKVKIKVIFTYLDRERIRALKIKNPVMGRPDPGWFYRFGDWWSGPYDSEAEARRYYASHEASGVNDALR